MPSMAQGGLRNFTENPNQLNRKFPNHEAKVDPFSREQKIAQHRKSLTIASELPQFLFNAGFCRDGRTIGITQPRHVTAVTVAKQVAEECDVQLGQRVGYSIRFDDTTSGSTRIKYMTDGLLLREALLDPYLSKYSVIIVDEAHERTVHTDVLLGLLKNVQKARSKTSNDRLNIENKRTNDRTLLDKDNEDQAISFLKQCQGSKFPPLKLVIMSASLDARGFSEYFGGAKAVHIQGRQFPVDIFYTHYAEPDYLDAALITIFQIHLEEGPGDMLVFLTGQEEIESVERLIKERLQQLPEGRQKLLTAPIFSALPSEKQCEFLHQLQPVFVRSFTVACQLLFSVLCKDLI